MVFFLLGIYMNYYGIFETGVFDLLRLAGSPNEVVQTSV